MYIHIYTYDLKCKSNVNVLYLYRTFLVIVDNSKCFYNTRFAFTCSHPQAGGSDYLAMCHPFIRSANYSHTHTLISQHQS